MEKPKEQVVIKAPNFQMGVFEIKGTSPLVVHRFSRKVKEEMKQKMEVGKPASSKKRREAKNTDESFYEARYISGDGWDGFNASAIRAALISVCRLVGFKMTLAKLSVFVIPDGWDKHEPQIPLIRIYAEPMKQEDMARTSTGEIYLTVRAAYHEWSAKVALRWDADQFTMQDISNLLLRVGMQAGICEGRSDSPKSTGMGWGFFTLVGGQIDGN